MGDLVMAIDVGTGSARAGVFDRMGQLLGRAEHPTRMNRPLANYAEQSSEDIWQAACTASRQALMIADAGPEMVAGIGFDATCSLVVRDVDGQPQSASNSGDPSWDTIVWLDHRALAEAEECTATGHPVLDHIGGTMSPEMQLPKLMWLKRHFPERWASAGYLFDLADFLTWRASGSNGRSLCTLTCKWTYLSHEPKGWPSGFLSAIGLDDLLERGRLPDVAAPIGSDLGPLTKAAADDLGLTTDCHVAAGLIDAHAGVLGGMVARLSNQDDEGQRHATLVTGTSSSIMALSPEPRMIAGVWGPHFGAVLPERWLIDAGQSASGALLDHIIRLHREGGEPNAAEHRRLADRITELRAEEGDKFAARLHVLPDFHGNRSPSADARAVGVISGLDLDGSFDGLCRLYWRTAVGIALGLRHILERLDVGGYAIETLHVAGGHTRSPLLTQLYADATGCTLIEAEGGETILRGTAIIAAAAAGLHADLASAAARFARIGETRRPDDESAARYQRDYRIFLAMHAQQQVLDSLSA